MRSTRCCLQVIAYFLKISPHIKGIILYSKQSNLVDVGDDWDAGLSSQGMLSRLLLVSFREVEGCDAELKLLRFLLKHAKGLMKVALSFCSSPGSPDRERQMKIFVEKVRALPTSSSSVVITFTRAYTPPRPPRATRGQTTAETRRNRSGQAYQSHQKQ